ncbi:MAG: helix-turn-helix transcriptional regulator [Olsenella sp.]|nr:helix-turn-helix transcriptional regulator [Olsenella sp.]
MGRKSAGDYSPDDIKDIDPRRIAPRHENMRKAIGARGLTLEQFAKTMNVSESTLSRWLSGDEGNAKAYRLPNEALVRAARFLGVSVWYLLDLTDSPDGSGAKPFKQNEVLSEWWSTAKDPEKAAPVYEEPEPFGISTGVTTWRLSGTPGHKRFVRVSFDREDLWDWWVQACEDLGTPCVEEGEAKAAAEGYDAWERWFRTNTAESLRRDMLDLRGDYRDPLAVVRAELEYASKAADREKFDALLARIDAEAREAMDALA